MHDSEKKFNIKNLYFPKAVIQCKNKKNLSSFTVKLLSMLFSSLEDFLSKNFKLSKNEKLQIGSLIIYVGT